eukprot:CAMPEP_0172576712 /NCGR_PEP_ID=MMETSP1067-20121228/137863_1 /TAXON_ID=265564 ORGANISM="Thalassiosira punctigera, Strain Tpunct2005C2" /NCGR_SAMPLE_ID=MMETSP1067 /ASSEMBLY_ACC=CAM_ASM_000444 /LENGTH=415 /DNA_ID=CAMNT_0013369389 /DNA_START=32 /DNA_END=1279 /DNA_ORIENTATION=-
MRVYLSLLASMLLSSFGTPAALSLPSRRRQINREHSRAAFITNSISSLGAFLVRQQPVLASENASADVDVNNSSAQPKRTIIYRPLSIGVDGIRVPVAAWHPSADGSEKGIQIDRSNVTYEHRISVSKIGKQLAGWKLPSFVDRNFSLRPSSSLEYNKNVRIMSSPQDNQPKLPQSAPVILLAHGYLGSRFDLSHLGEALASRGFLVLAPEYPESLAASYDATASATGIPVDRTIITNELLETLTGDWDVRPAAYGICGHSLGCGTVDQTGDETWTRACLAGGGPSLRGPGCLFVGSVGDGAVSVGRALDALREGGFASLDEDAVRSRSWGELPPRSCLIFCDPRNAPNHISFLAEETNDAMVEFLSPLLPVARALGIPVLDFDKYQTSRDSVATGNVVVPLVVDYFSQRMMQTS